ncbi:hypothetical protein CYMTET_49437 [Cymbomonas tetramitiformis]|uniref:Uncharacterized protein n=1 Tax=Cymbomonas tetramitiformis TaxID=36881 RepID=A0AAE0BRE3_9CHLO|nr:hypothetical protein CYMTET_49437 [Cymbomonas tetramitiformis]|eukprot:gene4799-5866_t
MTGTHSVELRNVKDEVAMINEIRKAVKLNIPEFPLRTPRTSTPPLHFCDLNTFISDVAQSIAHKNVLKQLSGDLRNIQQRAGESACAYQGRLLDLHGTVDLLAGCISGCGSVPEAELPYHYWRGLVKSNEVMDRLDVDELDLSHIEVWEAAHPGTTALQQVVERASAHDPRPSAGPATPPATGGRRPFFPRRSRLAVVKGAGGGDDEEDPLSAEGYDAARALAVAAGPVESATSLPVPPASGRKVKCYACDGDHPVRMCPHPAKVKTWLEGGAQRLQTQRSQMAAQMAVTEVEAEAMDEEEVAMEGFRGGEDKAVELPALSITAEQE